MLGVFVRAREKRTGEKKGQTEVRKGNAYKDRGGGDGVKERAEEEREWL